jgi:hypothetical protein
MFCEKKLSQNVNHIEKHNKSNHINVLLNFLNKESYLNDFILIFLVYIFYFTIHN